MQLIFPPWSSRRLSTRGRSRSSPLLSMLSSMIETEEGEPRSFSPSLSVHFKPSRILANFSFCRESLQLLERIQTMPQHFTSRRHFLPAGQLSANRNNVTITIRPRPGPRIPRIRGGPNSGPLTAERTTTLFSFYCPIRIREN